VADQITTDENGSTYKNGVLQSRSKPSPGVGGAINDAIGALASSFGPKAITQRKSKVDTAVNDALGSSF